MASDQYISEEQMLLCLRQAYSQDAEQSLLWQLLRKIEDPVTPRNEKNRRRFDPLLLKMAALIILGCAAFVYFWLLSS
jgi:hypothetical protein